MLALAQTRQVVAALQRAHPDLDIRIEIISTRGDQRPDVPLGQLGRKGVFTRELETALLERRIDLAVHSAKDLPFPTPPGLAILGVPPREDPRDALIVGAGAGAVPSPDSALANLPEGGLVGTGSLRRQAQLKLLRPDLRFTVMRGNIETRIAKVRRGECDATVLALAGLNRAGLSHEAAAVFEPEELVPAPGQGVLALEGRGDDADLRELLRPLHDLDSCAALECERGLVAALGASCTTPVGALARVRGQRVQLTAVVAAPDGARVARAQVASDSGDIGRVVAEAARQLRADGATEILAACA